MSVTDTSPNGQIIRVAEICKSKPFIPAPFLSQTDLQTFGAYFWPGRFRVQDVTGDETRLFEVEQGSQVLARCRWQPNRTEAPTIVIWHGMEGSTASAYMLTTADKAFRRGFNVVRVNIRNCGDTEHLSPQLYHAGLTDDLRAVIDELLERDELKRMVIVGFSLGGNLALKLAGEYEISPPAELRGVCAISPSVDLRASTNLISQRRNWVYHQSFLLRLKKRITRKAELFPALYDASNLRSIRSIEDFDNRYVARAFGFADAGDYYAKASSLPYISRIRMPTLIIHAQDDPFIPFAPLRDLSVSQNANVLLLAPARGGHVAFINANGSDEDRFWAENRLVDFCRTVVE
jgi:predicted alpha/beta-fold hydrolase